MHSRAYTEGYKAGQADAARQWRSEYVWSTRPDEGDYVWNYSVGYRNGWLGKLADFKVWQ